MQDHRREDDIGFDIIFRKAHYGIVVSRRSKTKHGIRLFPYCEVYGATEKLEKLRHSLLSLSISCTVRGNFLRIQGIRNCSLITQFVPEKKSWFKEAVRMFEEGEHLEPEGMIKLIRLRDKRVGARKMENKVSLNEVIKTVLEH